MQRPELEEASPIFNTIASVGVLITCYELEAKAEANSILFHMEDAALVKLLAQKNKWTL